MSPHLPKRGKRQPWEPKRVTQGGRRYRDKRYNTTRWRKLRLFMLKRSPLCVECGAAGRVLDHITPVRHDPATFWDTDNLQVLCDRCHNRKSATTDKLPPPDVSA